MSEPLEAVVYVMYEWDCPYCCSVHGSEFDERGDVVECPDCREKVKLC